MGPKTFQHVDFLAAHFLRECNYHVIAFDCTCEREADSRVARGGLYERVARLDASRALGILDHTLADPVLYRSTRIEVLAFGKNLACNTMLLGDLVQAHQGSVADGIQCSH